MEWYECGSRNRNKERLQQNPLSSITTGHGGGGQYQSLMSRYWGGAQIKYIKIYKYGPQMTEV